MIVSGALWTSACHAARDRASFCSARFSRA